MAAKIDTHGDIEVICQNPAVKQNEFAQIIFRTWGELTPPFKVQVVSPSGRAILDRVVRVLPTGNSHVAPAVTFSVQAGDYAIMIQQVNGSAEGKAVLSVT